MTLPLFGILVGTQTAGGTGIVYNRTCGSGSPTLCHEARVQLDSGVPSFRFGANRDHYLFATDTFPDSRMAQDKLYNRLPLVSHKFENPPSTQWTAIGAASPTVNFSVYQRITRLGDEIANWQDLNVGVGKWGCTFQWSFHHEPNNETGFGGTLALQSEGWRSAFINILDIWRNVCGVRFWVGSANNSLATVTEGIIPIINLVSGISSNHQNDIQSYWGNDADMNRLCRGYMGDPYNIGTRFRPFSNLNSDVKSWSDAKAVTQAAAGRTMMQGVWETGTRDTNGYTNGTDPSWDATGLAPNKANWYLNVSQFLKTTYNYATTWAYFDNAPAHSNQPDQTQASWNSWVANLCTNDIDIATSPIPGGPVDPPPPPSGDFFPGIVPPEFRPKIGA